MTYFALADDPGNPGVGISAIVGLSSAEVTKPGGAIDTLSDIEILIGSEHIDGLVTVNANVTLRGGGGNDGLGGSGVNSTLFGDAGDDLLIGGTGDDSLSGGLGNDLFIFNIGDGDDTITDFEATNDNEKIDLTGYALTGIGDPSLSINQVGLDSVVSVGGDSITLQGVDSADLDSNDFLF